ncbi:hypothetical protein OIDMADRAFT_25907 [Oidiodendron maius Zn]|uniref:Uncharacterized protein n=1 Tax=Oidiodendron maius (strain Zn) TaxID=913774 RepID=A0A0C3HAS1_OIDMZ|nr:hypothetical protein OIDMADRAFT_25907 [Oidiodendron maius Zn]
MSLPMTFGCGLYDRMTGLYTKEVNHQGIDLNFTAVHHPRDLFDKQAKNAEFDCSELSASDNRIKGPSDLKGARISLQLYTMAACCMDSRVVAGRVWCGLVDREIDRRMVGIQLGDINAVIGAEVSPSLSREQHIKRVLADFQQE